MKTTLGGCSARWATEGVAHPVKLAQAHVGQHDQPIVADGGADLVGQREVVWQSRAHFYGIAAQAMRRILVDHARRRNAARRGGGQRDLTLVEDIAGRPTDPIDVIALDQALTELAELDPRGAKIVEVRFFSGLNIQETAEVLGVSEVTVKRDWRYAKAWLYRKLSGNGESERDQV